MPKSKPWLKLWIEWIHDPKMLGLTLAETGAWWKLVTLAQELAQDGRISESAGRPLNIDEIANCLHLSKRTDIRHLMSMVEKMQRQSSLHWDGATLVITKFADRQSQVPSATREAVRDRVKRHRRRQLETEKALHGVPPSPPLLETEGEEETEGESNVRKLVTSNDNSVILQSVSAQIVTLFEENIGQLPGIVGEDIREFCESFSGDISWIRPAFKEALTRNKRNWKYIRAILENWQDEGGPPDAGRNQGLSRRAADAGAGAPRRYTREEAEADGWTVNADDETDPED